MSLDISNLSPQARNDYILVGRQFSSTCTLAQANFTLLGLSTHAAELEEHGFSAADAQRLLDARDALVDAGGGRQEAAGSKKLTGVQLRSSVKSARAARENARSVLRNTRRALHERSDPASVAAVEKIDVVLDQTRRAPKDANALAEQLDALRGVLGGSTIEPEASTRGGPKAVAELLDLAPAVRAVNAARPGKAGTPAATERLDLLDGIIVALVRHAHEAAGSAAKRLGTPALLAAFDLSNLYPSRKAAKAPAPAPAPAGG